MSVRDSGTGLTSLTATQLFEPFYTTKGDGMGMGLSIVRTIIERMRDESRRGTMTKVERPSRST